MSLLGQFFRDRQLKSILTELLGFRPGDVQIYRNALTHKSALSALSDRSLSNERLEFLGDAVLSLITAEFFFEKYPDYTEGQLSQIRSRIVNRELFNSIGRRMKLDKLMERVAPHNADVENSPSMLGNALEAIVGAVFVDKGYETARKFFEKEIVGTHLDISDVDTEDTNYKSRLLEWGQKTGNKIDFVLKSINREDNKLVFQVDAVINGELKGSGTGSKKKKAEQLASKEALSVMNL